MWEPWFHFINITSILFCGFVALNIYYGINKSFFFLFLVPLQGWRVEALTKTSHSSRKLGLLELMVFVWTWIITNVMLLHQSPISVRVCAFHTRRVMKIKVNSSIMWRGGDGIPDTHQDRFETWQIKFLNCRVLRDPCSGWEGSLVVECLKVWAWVVVLLCLSEAPRRPCSRHEHGSLPERSVRGGRVEGAGAASCRVIIPAAPSTSVRLWPPPLRATSIQQEVCGSP